MDVNPNAVIVCGGGRKNKFLMKSFENKIDCPLIEIDDLIDKDPSILLNAPYKTCVRRLDEVRANREPVLKWEKE